MNLRPINIEFSEYPPELHDLLKDACLFDSSCSPEAKVIFVDKDGGYFIKSARKGTLKREAEMTCYFNSFGLSAKVLAYISDKQDFFITEKIKGDDCVAAKYLNQPERLCDILAQRLLLLHGIEPTACPVANHTEKYLEIACQNYHTGKYDKDHFPDSFGYASAEEAWRIIENRKHLLKTDTLLHGDYCLPNIILENWNFSGFIDLDNGGVGDKHVDIFWAIWTLFFNLKTDKYRKRFIDAYGRDKIDDDVLSLVAAIEVFG